MRILRHPVAAMPLRSMCPAPAGLRLVPRCRLGSALLAAARPAGGGTATAQHFSRTWRRGGWRWRKTAMMSMQRPFGGQRPLRPERERASKNNSGPWAAAAVLGAARRPTRRHCGRGRARVVQPGWCDGGGRDRDTRRRRRAARRLPRPCARRAGPTSPGCGRGREHGGRLAEQRSGRLCH